MSSDSSIFVTGLSQQKSEQEPYKFTVSHGIWLSFGLIDAMIAVRIAFLLIGANPLDFAVSQIYSFTHFFLIPFAGIFGSSTAGSMHFEISSMIAMMTYLLAAGIVEKVVWFLRYNPIEPVTGNRSTNLHHMIKNDERE